MESFRRNRVFVTIVVVSFGRGFETSFGATLGVVGRALGRRRRREGGRGGQTNPHVAEAYELLKER